MNQISIGDSSAWSVIEGQSIAAPFRKASLNLVFSSKPIVREKIDISLVGTPTEINTALTTLNLIAARAEAYARGEYSKCQYIRYQLYGGGSYYYTIISEIYLSTNPTGYRDHARGSLLVELHYTRPNYFDGTQFQLPLTGRAGSEVTGGIQIVNHTDADANDGNTLCVNAGDAAGDLPSPLRLEIQNNTAMSAWYRVLVGAYHHPTYTGEDIFFCQTADMIGGTSNPSPTAISGAYRGVGAIPKAWQEQLENRQASAKLALRLVEKRQELREHP